MWEKKLMFLISQLFLKFHLKNNLKHMYLDTYTRFLISNIMLKLVIYKALFVVLVVENHFSTLLHK